MVINAARTTPKDISSILFIGDSITSHRPAPHLGWNNDWGMAATAREKDYVHRLVDFVSKQQGRPPAFKIFGKGGGTLIGTLAEADTLSAAAAVSDVIIIQMGENDKPTTVEAFQNPYARLLDLLRTANQTARIFCTGVWSPPGGSPVKDAFIRELCDQGGHVFVDLAGPNSHPLARADSKQHWDHIGVAWHPGDDGMEAYATVLLAALNGQLTKKTGASPLGVSGANSISFQETFSLPCAAPLMRKMEVERFIGRTMRIQTAVNGAPVQLALDLHNAEGEHEIMRAVSPLVASIPDNIVEITLAIDGSPAGATSDYTSIKAITLHITTW